MVARGLDYFDSRQYAEALKWLKKAADLGSSVGQYNLARMYVEGQGVEKNYEKALSLLHLSAEQGDSRALYGIGVMYKRGLTYNSKNTIE